MRLQFHSGRFSVHLAVPARRICVAPEAIRLLDAASRTSNTQVRAYTVTICHHGPISARP